MGVAGAGVTEAPGVVDDVPGTELGADAPGLLGPGVSDAAGVPTGVPPGDAIGTVVKIGEIIGVGVGFGPVMLPWPNTIANRNTSPNTTATPTTHHFDTGS